MKQLLICAVVLVSFVARAQTTATASKEFRGWAPNPPMGWNSWDCFGPAANEEVVLANAEYMAKHLKSHGWEYVIIDGRWCRPGTFMPKGKEGMDLEMDEDGRLQPAPNKFPSSRDGKGFKPLADKVHALGLKFGVHILRGIPRKAYNQNVAILGTSVHAKDITNTSDTCNWSDDTYGLDFSKAEVQAYYDSVFALMASWGLDYIKVDDLARNYHKDDIDAIRRAIDKCGRKIVFATSPGPLKMDVADHISAQVNTWRISQDLWDNWRDVYEEFGFLDQWSKYAGPGHFPDADMLPLGSLRNWDTKGPKWTQLTRDEQITMMTLWCIGRSSLMVGAHLPKNDEWTLSLLTNDEVLAVSQRSEGNRQVSRRDEQVIWTAKATGSDDVYVAMFNTSPAPEPGRRRVVMAGTPTTQQTPPAEMSISLADLKLDGPHRVRDLWEHRDLDVCKDKLTAKVNSHGAVLYKLSKVEANEQ
jgi:hypothetical protein